MLFVLWTTMLSSPLICVCDLLLIVAVQDRVAISYSVFLRTRRLPSKAERILQLLEDSGDAHYTS